MKNAVWILAVTLAMSGASSYALDQGRDRLKVEELRGFSCSTPDEVLVERVQSVVEEKVHEICELVRESNGLGMNNNQDVIVFHRITVSESFWSYIPDLCRAKHVAAEYTFSCQK